MKAHLVLVAVGSLGLSAACFGQVKINEVDSDTPGTDALEFIELTDGGIGNTPLDGLVVVLYNGSIVEEGVHQELYERRGMYHQLVQKQMAGTSDQLH